MWRGPMLHKLLEEFLTKVLWDAPDYLLFDMPPGTGDVALSMHNYLPQAELIVVTTPQPAAQRVAQRSGTMAEKIGTPVVGVVENMSWFTGDDGHRYELFGSGGGQQLADRLGVPLIGQVPFVPARARGGRHRRADRRQRPRLGGGGRHPQDLRLGGVDRSEAPLPARTDDSMNSSPSATT